MPKTWKAKLEIDKQRCIVPMPDHLRKKWGDGTLLIPIPLDVDAAIRKIPKGRLVTMSELRQNLADEFGASKTCAMCTGMFWRIAAEAAEEAGDKRLPYWRIVKDDGALNEKLPGGAAAHARHLKEEGHSISAGLIPSVNVPLH